MQWTRKAECRWGMRSQLQLASQGNNGRFWELCHKNAEWLCHTTVCKSFVLEFTRFHHTCWNTTTLKTAYTGRFQTKSTGRTRRWTKTSHWQTWSTTITWRTRFRGTVSRWRSARLPTTQWSWRISRKSGKITLHDLLHLVKDSWHCLLMPIYHRDHIYP